MNSLDNHRIYADHNATSPLLSNLVDKVSELFSMFIANPTASHGAGLLAQEKIEQARSDIAQFLKCEKEHIIFTSTATEANATALYSHFVTEYVNKKQSKKNKILISAIEHPSVGENAKALIPKGANVIEIPVFKNGMIDLDFLLDQLKNNDIAIVSVMWANNEVGVIQPVYEIVRLCKNYDVRVHIDAVQACAKIDINPMGVGADSYAISGHKIGSLAGSAILIKNTPFLSPLILGGGQENNIRSGSIAWHSILALQLTFLEWQNHANVFRKNMKSARDIFEKMIEQKLSDIVIVAKNALRIPNTSNIIVEGIKAQVLLPLLDLNGVAVSHGSACSSGSLSPSHVISAMGFTPNQAKSSIRVSFGPESSVLDGSEVAQCFIDCVNKIRNI